MVAEEPEATAGLEIIVLIIWGVSGSTGSGHAKEFPLCGKYFDDHVIK